MKNEDEVELLVGEAEYWQSSVKTTCIQTVPEFYL